MGWFSPTRSYSSSQGHRSHSHSHRSSSHHSRRPRDGYSDGYLKRVIYKAKRALRKLIAYARRHPVKMFFMVIMPLISGGALAGVLKTLGIRLPRGMVGDMLGGRRGGFDDEFSSIGSGSGLSNLGGGGGISSALKVVKMFM
ncbi:MAG: hypothetical protein M1833_003248 [Piccolia ochrophora]|nr:MAG: hypothetical protein M1833_003248 [Piccolia ochrophora]